MLVLKLVGRVVVGCVEGIVSLGLTVILVLPVLALLWLLNGTWRALVGLYLWWKHDGRVRLTRNGLDNIWGYRTPGGGNSRNVLFVATYGHVIDGLRYRARFLSDVIEFVDPSSGRRPYEKLKRIFVKECGYYCWKEDPNFDIANHVLVWPNDRVVTETELMGLLRELSQDMDETRPQWQEIIIPNFRYDTSEKAMADNKANGRGQQSLRILRFHHSYGDAGSWLLLYSYCMAGGKIPYAVNPLKGFPIPAWQMAAYYASAVLFGTTTVIKAMWYGTNVRSNRLLTRSYNGDKFFAWTDWTDLNRLKEIKRRTRTAIPTIVASVIAAAIRRFDEAFPLGPKMPGIQEETDIGAVAAILPYPSLKLMNRFTIANFTVPTGSMSRSSRLLATHKSCLRLAHTPEPLLNFWMFSFFGRFPIPIQNFLMQSAGTSLIFSNLPGASTTFQLMGDSVMDGGAWVPLLTVAGLSISAAGYRDNVRFCGSTDSSCMSQDQLHFFLTTIIEEIELLFQETVGNV